MEKLQIKSYNDASPLVNMFSKNAKLSAQSFDDKISLRVSKVPGMCFSQDKLNSIGIINPNHIQEEMDDDEDEIQVPNISFTKIQNDDDIKFRLM